MFGVAIWACGNGFSVPVPWGGVWVSPLSCSKANMGKNKGKHGKTPKRGPLRLVNRFIKVNKTVADRASASSGKWTAAHAKKKRGQKKSKEAPGPAYSSGKKGATPRLARKSKEERIGFRQLASLSAEDLVRVGEEIGFLPRKTGTKCPLKCGGILSLRAIEGRGAEAVVFGNFSFPPRGVPRLFCDSHFCEGNKHGFAVEEKGSDVAIQLGGRGRAPAGEGLLCVCLASLPWAGHHCSVSDGALLMHVNHQSMQLYADEVRRAQAILNDIEQAGIVFGEGVLVEWDECGIRAEQKRCAKPCTLFWTKDKHGQDTKKSNCVGFRLLWNRRMIGVERGNRKNMVVKQLPFKTANGKAGGVPLSEEECDAVCIPHLGKYAINLTDGAMPYEAFAGGQIVCSSNCERKDCIARAHKAGKAKCTGSRPREGRDRFKQHYAKLHMSHGIATHEKEEWAVIKEVRVWNDKGSKVVKLKHGTEVADGAWAELKRAYPHTVKNADHDRIAEYIKAWAWRARRHGEDTFVDLGKAIAARR